MQASPLNWVTPNASPCITIHGTEDRYVAYEQAVWITETTEIRGSRKRVLALKGLGMDSKVLTLKKLKRDF